MRWNSVAEMIESVLYLRIPLDRLVKMDRHNTVAKTCLRKLKILPKEWDVLSQLTKVLSVSILLHFALLAADLSQAFPRSNTSTVTKKDSTSSWGDSCHRYSYGTTRWHLWQTRVPTISANRCCKGARSAQQILCEDRWIDHVQMRHEYVPSYLFIGIWLFWFNLGLGSTPSQVQAVVLPDKEMAWGVDRNGKGGLARAMVDELQARRSFGTCVSVIIIGAFKVVSKLMNIRSNYLCDTGWKGQLILITWRLRHWWFLWRTGRILKYTHDFDQISWSFNVVACDWRKPTCALSGANYVWSEVHFTPYPGPYA